jgi:D-threo-aldose 1-dehydrogenase
MYKIGFGCAGLTSINNRKESLFLLEHAFSEGIIHFDVARLYGMGMAESIVGEFAGNKRDAITITTKFGLNPPAVVIKSRGLTNVVKKSIKRMPFVKKMVTSKIHSKIESDFTIKNAQVSLEKSLTELKTDYIDYWLLHEATKEVANSEEIIDFMETKVKEGKILKYGIGTAYSGINNDCNLFNSAYYIFQFENNIFNENLLNIKNHENKLLITHSVFKEYKIIRHWLNRTNVELIQKYSNEIDIDLKDSKVIAGMLLYRSSMLNPNGITLFSSTQKNNISNNMKYLKQFIQLNNKMDVINRIIKLIKNDLN